MSSFWAMRVVLAGLVLGCGLGWGQAPPAGQGKPVMLAEPPTPLLPGQVGDLTGAVSSGKAGEGTFDEGTCAVSGVAAGGGQSAQEGTCARVLKEDGLARLAVADYSRASGGPVRVSATQFGDATGAFSAYTFYRSLMKAPRVIGAGAGANETSVDAGGTLVWAGTAVLRVAGELPKQELAKLVSALPKVSGGKGLAPLLPTLFDKQGMEAASLRYAIGPVGYGAMHGGLPADLLGWDKSAEVATATYHGKGELTLMLYPTPQIAGDRGRAVEAAVNTDRARYGEVKMRRLGPLVGVTTGGLSEEQAESLIAGLHLDAVVTFDQKQQPEFHAEVRKTASLLQNIAVLTGVLILAAVLLGLFLGGARAGIRRLQGKPAYSEPEFLTISLRDKPNDVFPGLDKPRD